MYADTLETAALWGLPIYTMDVLREKVRERANKHLYPIGLEVPENAEILDVWVYQKYEHLFTGKTDVVVVDAELAQLLELKYRDSVDYNRKAKDIEVGDTLYSGEKVTETTPGFCKMGHVVYINEVPYQPEEVLEIV